MRANAPGARSSARPRPMLNQPSARAAEREAALRPASLRGIFMASSSVRFQNCLDAAVLLVAEGLVHLRAVLELAGVGDDERRVDHVLLDHAQQAIRPAVH